GMVHRPAGVIGDEILLAHIGNAVIIRILGKQVIERLILARSRVFGDRLIPVLAVGEARIDVEDDTPEWMIAMADHLAEAIFCRNSTHEQNTPKLPVSAGSAAIPSRTSRKTGKQSVNRWPTVRRRRQPAHL